MNTYYDSFDCEICCEEVYGGTATFEVDDSEFFEWGVVDDNGWLEGSMGE